MRALPSLLPRPRILASLTALCGGGCMGMASMGGRRIWQEAQIYNNAVHGHSQKYNEYTRGVFRQAMALTLTINLSLFGGRDA